MVFLLGVGVVNTVLSIYYGWRRWWAPVIAFPIGFAPMISNITAHEVASWLGCEIHEWYAYHCPVGPIDISGLLSLMVIAGLLIGVTWPFAIASIVLFAAALVRSVRRRMAR